MRGIMIAGLMAPMLAGCATTGSPPAANSAQPATSGAETAAAKAQADAGTYDKGDVLLAADAAFGQGAAGMGAAIERVFSELGQPNAYIVGREGSGALVVGLRYGSGTLYHKIEGERRVFWQGPSIGFDAGGDASRVFTLVYNLNDTEELYRRYPAVEGRAYLVGGVAVTYHQRGRTILVPLRLGAGWRLGANVGYLNFSKEARAVPF
jgi:hypothetical protein